MRWVDVIDPVTGDIVEALGREIHPLALEDARKAHQRPKIEQYGEMSVLVMKPAAYDPTTETLAVGDVLVVMDDDVLLSVRHGVGSRVVSGVTSDGGERSIEPEDRRRILHRMLDQTVDEYLRIARELAVDIAEIEADVFSVEFTNPSARAYRLKRQVLELLRHAEALLEPVEAIATGPQLADIVGLGHAEYVRDVADHASRVVSELERDSALLSDVLAANLAQVAVAQNEDMRRMSAWAAIFLAPTLGSVRQAAGPGSADDRSSASSTSVSAIDAFGP